ncbi:MAG: hypothetical protein ACKVT1_01360 [Dehalococcoidia bacterium]
MTPRGPLSPDDLGPAGQSTIARLVRRPQVVLPIVVVAGMLAVAFGLQPGSAAPPASKAAAPSIATAQAATQTPVPSPSPSATAAGKTVQSGDNRQADTGTVTAEVAGARSTPADAETDAIDLSRETTQCGSIQEQSVAISVEQTISGVGVRATRAAVYPIAYLRCMFMASGSRDAVSLAASLGRAERDGEATHAAVLDLWIANSGRDFGQVNLKTASIAAAGQAFPPLATLGGRGEVVVSSGEGRTVSLIVALKNALGPNTGPMTLTIEPPLVGGKQMAGKYQLFLPTP